VPDGGGGIGGEQPGQVGGEGGVAAMEEARAIEAGGRGPGAGLVAEIAGVEAKLGAAAAGVRSNAASRFCSACGASPLASWAAAMW
jgi:hypothetical protein